MKNEDEGLFMTLMDEGVINLHVRGGYILPLQKSNLSTALRWVFIVTFITNYLLEIILVSLLHFIFKQ